MSDVDDELLALAGGDVSSSEDEAMDMSRDGSRSPSPPPASSSKDKEAPSRGTAAKTTSKKAKGRASRSDDESEDEGEASPPGSPSSQMSAPMDESDSDSDAPPTRQDDEVLYPIEGLFKSLEEKARIMSMREIEREQILAERREENERIRQNRMLRQLKVNQEKDSKKRKASIADLEDASSRKPSRARTKAGESSEKMDTLRRAREERSNRKEQRERERERESDRRRQRSPSYRRSRSASSRRASSRGSDDDWRGDSRRRSRSPDQRETAADLHDVERIRLGRSRFAEVCYNPGFEKAITGCYVRINIGPDPATRQEVYRMAVIKGFTQGRPYALTDARGHQMVVDLYVKAAHGKAQREWPFITCSDRPFTESEWERYKKVCLSEGLPIPAKPDLVAKIDDINRLLRHTWTEQELAEKLKKQNALHIKYSGVERDHVAKQLDLARARGDEEAVARLQEKLENLEVPRLAFRTQLKTAAAAASGKRSDGNGPPSQQEKLALLNLENRRKNAETVRKAQLLERARAKKQVEEAQRKKAESAAANGSGDSRGATPGGEAGGGSTLPHIAKLQELQRKQEEKKGVPVIHKPLMEDDIIGALDLDIDVEIE
ncbi:hypothetical protein VTJ83DRAFT_7455 [Remersonia thermophila]|uniref:Plus3 domain-containing protein n=1 Tax=Remersonia thermophila TaxID=72144 RepID=A0ABR4D4J6_9PEZI